MASTLAGDRIQDGLQAWNEWDVRNRTVHYSILAQALMSRSNLSPAANASFLSAVQRAHSVLVPAADSVFSAAYSALKYVETGKRDMPFTPPASLDLPSLMKKAMITGPTQAVKKANAAAGSATIDELDKTFNYVAQTLSQETSKSVQANNLRRIAGDPDVVRYARNPEASACGFCLMLTRRGAVYHEKGSHFESHNNCKCTASPVFETHNFTPANQAEIDKWLTKNSTAAKRARKYDRDEKVKEGLLKVETKTYQKYKVRETGTGTSERVPDGVGQRTVYVKTQKALEQEAAEKYARSKEYKAQAHNPNKPAHAPVLSKAEVDTEIQKLDELLTIPTASPPSPLTAPHQASLEEYRAWARRRGLLDEALIATAYASRQEDIRIHQAAMVQREALKASTQIADLADRVRSFDRLIGDGKVHPVAYWMAYLKTSEAKTRQVLAVSGVGFTG